MSKFDLGSFVKKEEKGDLQGGEKPLWVKGASEKVCLAYDTAVNMLEDIRKRIESGEVLSPKERKLVMAKIAYEIGVDRSYLTERRTPDFCKFCKDSNEELSDFWLKHKPRSGSKTSKLAKSDLLKEVTKYKNLYKHERDKNYSDVVSRMLESDLYGSTKKTAQKCADLEEKNTELTRVISNLRSRLRSYTINEVS